MADIFMSYASEDRERARTLAEALTAGGWTVWWDREIPIGRAYTDVIEQELTTAGCVIVLWSEESVKSQWVCNEAREGYSRHVLVPVLIDAVRVPLEFRHLQTASLVDWEPGSDSPEFAKVESAIRTFSKKEGVPVPVPVAERPPRTNRRAFLATLGGMGVVAVLMVVWLTCWREVPSDRTERTDRTDRTDTNTTTITDTTTSAPVTETTSTTSTVVLPPPVRAMPGVGRIMVGGSATCMAVLVSRTQALTFRPCIAQQSHQRMVLQLGDTNYPFAVLWTSGTGDESFVLLALATPADREFAPIRISRRAARVGETVIVGGTDRTRVLSVDKYIVYELKMKQGSMGAPVVGASDNLLIGVHWGKQDVTHPNLKRAIPTPKLPNSILE